jgi:hypothetical protein
MNITNEIKLNNAVIREMRIARECATKDELEQYLKDHPKADKSKHTVKGEGTPKEEKPKEEKKPKKTIKKTVKEKTKEVKEKIERSVEERLNEMKNLSNVAKANIESLPQKSKEILIDPEKRKEAMQKSAKTLREKSVQFGKKLVKEFKHEVKEAGSGVKKILKGEKPNKAEVKAIATLAVEVGAAAAVASSGGAMIGAGYLGKSLIKHTVLSAINPWLGNIYILGQAVDLASKIASEEEKELSDKELTAIIVTSVMEVVADQLEKGMSDEEAIQAMNGEFPKVDLTDVEMEG